jgi:hypothetical protein
VTIDWDLADCQSEGARKERAMQSELDSLANVKTTAVANKASKQQQIVCYLLPTLRRAEQD